MGRFFPVRAAACLAALVMFGAGARAQVAPVDRYKVTTQIPALAMLQVTGMPGALAANTRVTVTNTRTWEATGPVTPAPDGSFVAQVGGIRGDSVSLIVSDLQDNTSAPTFVSVGTLNIKNPYRPGGYWYVGQGHTHTNHSDGANTPNNLEAAYAMAGYDFVVSTDHRGWPSPWYMAEDSGLTPDPTSGWELLWIPGTEIGNYNVHLGSWGTTDYVPFSMVYDTQNAVDATRELGGIAVIHHPENVDPPYAWDWHDEIMPIRDVSLIEAFNGKHAGEGTVENHIVDAIDLADEFQQVWWVGSDDCHDVNDPQQFNRFAIVVQSDSATVTQPDMIASADAGRLYIRQTAQGPAITAITVSGNEVQLTLPQVAAGYTVEWYRRGGELAERDLGVGTYAAYTVQGSEGYVRAEVKRLSDGKKAWTQPLFIANNKDLSVSASSAALVDNDSSTVWDAGGPTGSFVIDVGQARNINAIRIDWDANGGRRFNYQVDVSDTGVFLGEERPAVRQTYSNRLSTTLDFFDDRARFVRVLIGGQSVGTPGNARVREVEVFDATPARTNLFIDNVRGDDANTGRAGSPWKTFAYARERVRPRDTLNFIQNAVPYPGLMQIEARHGGKNAGATVEFRGAYGLPARVDASGSLYGVTISGVQWVKWADFDISLAISADLLISGGANVVVEHNRLHHAQGRGVLGGGDFTLAYNEIYANAGDGVMVYTDGTLGRLYNNVIANNGGDGLTVQNVGTVDAQVRNNIFSGNAGNALARIANGNVTDTHNCVSGTYYGPWQKFWSIAADPQFTNPAAADFSLQLTSPCIDAGVDLNYSADIDGNPVRDVLSVPDKGNAGNFTRTYTDIGAHEACDTCNGGGICHQ